MSNYYIQHGLYPTYSATPPVAPAAGAAQDGDGVTKGLATAAYMTYNFAAITASAGNTAVVCGATLTGVSASPAANQFATGAGVTGASLVTSLVTAINAATNAVSAAATGWTTPQLRNAVYASASGAVLTVQTRAGSAVYNSNAAWSFFSSTGFAGTTITTTSFSGGASGAWGYVTNDLNIGVMWPSAVAAWGYGLNGTGSNAFYLAGPAPTGADYVWVKSGLPNSASIFLQGNTISTNTIFYPVYSMNMVVDDGTLWTSDATVTTTASITNASSTITVANATGIVVNMVVSGAGIYPDTYVSAISGTTITLTRPVTANGSSVTLVFFPALIFLHVQPTYQLLMGCGDVNMRVYIGTSTVGRLVFRAYHTTSGGPLQIGNLSRNSSTFVVENGTYIDAHASPTNGIVLGAVMSADYAEVYIVGGQYITLNNKFIPTIGPISTGGFFQNQIQVENVTFSWLSFTGTPTYLCAAVILTAIIKVVIRNCNNLTAGLAPYVFGGTALSLNNAALAIAENNSGFSVNNNLGLLGLAPGSVGVYDLGTVVQQNVGAIRQTRVETNSYVRDWQPGAGFPTLTATLPDGTLWCYRILWGGSVLTGTYRNFSGIEFLKLAKTVTGTGYAVPTMELYVPTAVASLITNYHIVMQVSYVSASDGIVHCEYSTGVNASLDLINRRSASALPASTASWTANSFTGYSPVKLTFTLSNTIAVNTEVQVSLRFYDCAPSATQTIFVHPDIGLA